MNCTGESTTDHEEFRNELSIRMAGVVPELGAQLTGPQDVEGAITGVQAGNNAKSVKSFIVRARP